MPSGPSRFLAVVSTTYDIQFPEAIQKSNELVHSTTVVPTLQLLAQPAFKTANREML